MNAIPAQLIEAVDGALVPVFLIMTILAFAYLVRSWRENFYKFRGIEVEAKGAWAAALLFFGLSIKNDVIWINGHLVRQGVGLPWLDKYAQAAVVISSGIILWASFCWIRNVMPIRFNPWAWLWLIIFSVVFGIYFATS